MDIKEHLRSDLWNSIMLHYEKEDYTEAIRDSLLFINETVREKSGLDNKDGVKLMESAFLGKNASLRLNKCETETEKNIQQGIGFILKGLMMSVRNPISHERLVYSKAEATPIILYINYILNIVDKSHGINKIDDWMDFFLDEDLTNTERYAEVLIQEIPAKKRLDLLIHIFNDRYKFKQNKVNWVVRKLLLSISDKERKEIIEIANKDLVRCKNNNALRMFLDIFADQIYDELDILCKLRIENLVYKSISNGKIEHNDCNIDGALATWIPKRINLFETRQEILDLLSSKLLKSSSHQDYIFKYFEKVVFNSSLKLNTSLKKAIHIGLNERDFRFINALEYIVNLEDDHEWHVEFIKEYEKAIEQTEEEFEPLDDDLMPF